MVNCCVVQVLKKDYVAAGLCCIQLFLNSSNCEQALRHLEHAKVSSFEDLVQKLCVAFQSVLHLEPYLTMNFLKGCLIPLYSSLEVGCPFVKFAVLVIVVLLNLCDFWSTNSIHSWQVHFDDGLTARQQSGETTKGVTKASRGKLPSQKLTEDELIKFTSRVAIQVRVIVIVSDQVIIVSLPTGNK